MTDGPPSGPSDEHRAVAPPRPGGPPAAALAFAGGLALLLGSGAAGDSGPRWSGASVRTAPRPAPETGGTVDDFYGAHLGAALWTSGTGLRPEGRRLLDRIAASSADGFDPTRYGLPEIRADLAAVESGAVRFLPRLERRLSRAFAGYVGDLRSSVSARTTLFVDDGLAPRARPGARLLEAAATAPSLPRFAAEAMRMNPLYEQLRSAAGAAPSPRVAANLDRLRLLPGDGRKHVVVDAAGARLWMIEGGRIAGTMRVIVGKPRMETPQLAGLIRFEVRNPYWNVPPDLVRDRIAPRVLLNGPAALDSERLEIVSDWTPNARIVAPEEVDWEAVARGDRVLRVRQRPGGDNMMGAVKFMLPNRLGIYLHDTPDKAGFSRSDRRLSSGCVRLEDAERLSRWLLDGSAPPRRDGVERRIDLPRPVPVYITYLTAVADEGRVRLQADRYGRDSGIPAGK